MTMHRMVRCVVADQGGSGGGVTLAGGVGGIRRCDGSIVIVAEALEEVRAGDFVAIVSPPRPTSPPGARAWRQDERPDAVAEHAAIRGDRVQVRRAR